jgi:hypothetical protein
MIPIFAALSAVISELASEGASASAIGSATQSAAPAVASAAGQNSFLQGFVDTASPVVDKGADNRINWGSTLSRFAGRTARNEAESALRENGIELSSLYSRREKDER